MLYSSKQVTKQKKQAYVYFSLSVSITIAAEICIVYLKCSSPDIEYLCLAQVNFTFKLNITNFCLNHWDM